MGMLTKKILIGIAVITVITCAIFIPFFTILALQEIYFYIPDPGLTDPGTDPGTGPGTAPPPSWEIDASGTVSYIVDGDTLDVNSLGRVRLADINTPESGESGYTEAKNYLSSLVYGKSVYVDIDDIYQTGPYGRWIAVIYIDNNATHCKNINKAMLDSGLADIANYYNEFNPYTWTLFVPKL